MRGPTVAPGARPVAPTNRERFDRVALAVVTAVDERWADHLGLVEYAVEDAPWLPDDWGGDRVPLSSLVPGRGTTPTRLVLFRRPIEARAAGPADLRALVLTVVVEQVAELLGLPAEEVDPRYEG